MFNRNLNDSLQLLHNCVTEVEIMHSKHQHHHNFNLHLNHILNGLKTVQTSLRDTISQYLRLTSKLQNKISSVGKREAEQLGANNLGINKDLNFEELEMLIEQALIRRKLDHASFYAQQNELLLQEASLSKFPVLLGEIKKRRQSMRQIQQINHNLQTLERNLQLQTRKQEKTLESVLKRLEKINLSIIQAEDQFKDKKKGIERTDFIKYHNQTQNILKLIQYGNLYSLQQSTAWIQNSQLKTSVNKVIEQMKRYDQHTLSIYKFLYEIVKNNFSEMSKESQMHYGFLRSIERLNLSQKLKQCTKLITEYKKNPVPIIPDYVRDYIAQVSVIPESVRSCLDAKNYKTPIKPKKQATEHKVKQSQRDEHFYQQQMLLLQHQETIHELEQQLKVGREQAEVLQTFIQKKIDQISKLRQQNIFLQEQCEQLQNAIKNFMEKQGQKKSQREKALQSIVQLQGDILNLKGQLANVTQSHEKQTRTNQTLLIENRNQKATIEMQIAKIQNTKIKLQAVIAELACFRTINKEIKLQNQANKQASQNLKQIILQYHQKELTRIKHSSSKIVNNVYHLCIEPTYHPLPHSEEQYIQSNNIGEASFDQSFSEANSVIEKQNIYKVNIIQTKSFSCENQSEAMSCSLIKKEEHLDPQENELLNKSMCVKDKAIRKYEIYLNRYKHEIKKYQKEILDLQAKTRKLELQILQLNQIIEEQNIQKELLSVDQEPNDLYHHLNISEDMMEHSHIEKLTQKEVELRVKEESINFKIQGIIHAVMQLNSFKTESKHSRQNSMIDEELYALGLDSFNPQSHS